MTISQFILRNGSKILHKKSQVILTKNEGLTAIFPNFDFILNRENQRHAFIFAQNYLKYFFLCKILEPQCKKYYEIAIVKFCLHIVQNGNQSHANFQFFKV